MSAFSALPPWAFGRNAPRLDRGGYDPIPISLPDDASYKCAGKQPAQRKGWSKGCPVEDWPQFVACGVGILTRNTPAVDIDVMDEGLALAIQDVADHVLGDAPIRIGRAPKRLLPFRLKGEPFKKLKLTWSITEQEGAVEILADGEQFVCLGVHPETRQPYAWLRDPNLAIPRDLLPPLDEQRARRFLIALGRALREMGAERIRSSVQLDPPKPAPRHRRRFKPADDEAARMEAALKVYDNANLHYDDWIKVGHAIKAALGEAGFPLWCDWSAKAEKKNDPATTAAKWRTFRPDRIGAGAIINLGRRAGA